MRPTQPPDEDLQRSLAGVLGTAAFAAAYREGKHLTPAQALQHPCPAQHDERDDAAHHMTPATAGPGHPMPTVKEAP
jgi:hypothetical protein